MVGIRRVLCSSVWADAVFFFGCRLLICIGEAHKYILYKYICIAHFMGRMMGVYSACFYSWRSRRRVKTGCGVAGRGKCDGLMR